MSDSKARSNSPNNPNNPNNPEEGQALESSAEVKDNDGAPAVDEKVAEAKQLLDRGIISKSTFDSMVQTVTKAKPDKCSHATSHDDVHAHVLPPKTGWQSCQDNLIWPSPRVTYT